MEIGQKLRELRTAKSLSQGDVEHRTGLLRCYTSRVEHGWTIPTVETLEKYARALEIPLYRFFTDEQSVRKLNLPPAKNDGASWGADGKERRELRAFAKAISRMGKRNQKLLFGLAQWMASRSRSQKR